MTTATVRRQGGTMLFRGAVLVATSALLAACSGPMVVGVVLPETGASSSYGVPETRGVKVAFEAAVKAGTVPADLRVVYRDSASDPERAAAAMAELVKSGAIAVIGGATEDEAAALARLADDEKVVLVSPSSIDPEITASSVYVFSVCPSADLEAASTVDILVRVRSVRRVLVVTDDSRFARSLLSRFAGSLRSRSGEIVDTVSTGDQGWERNLRDRIVARQPGGVYLCAHGGALVAGLAAIRQARFEGVVCATSALADGEVLGRAGATAAAVLLPLPELDLAAERGPVADFVSRYRAATGTAPDHFAALGADAATAVALGISRMERRSASELQLRLKGLSEDRGVTGLLAFDDRGGIRHYPRAHWIRDGKVEDYEAYREQLRRELDRRARELGLDAFPR